MPHYSEDFQVESEENSINIAMIMESDSRIDPDHTANWSESIRIKTGMILIRFGSIFFKIMMIWSRFGTTEKWFYLFTNQMTSYDCPTNKVKKSLVFNLF